MACGTCRARKVKCDRSKPTCKNCMQRDIPCTYAGERAKRRRLNDIEGASFTSVFRFTENVRGAKQPEPRVRALQLPLGDQPVSQPHPVERQKSPSSSTPQSFENALSTSNTLSNKSEVSIGSEESFSHLAPREQQPVLDGLTEPLGLLDRILEGHSLDNFKNRSPSLWMRGHDGDEYIGPSSGLALLSDLGLEWIQKAVPNSPALCRTIREIRSDILSSLKEPKYINRTMGPALDSSTTLKPLPSERTLELYIDSYFSDIQCIFPILDRVKFKAQVLEHTSGKGESNDAWKALFYAVLASGCRAALSDETPEAFQESDRESWAYFQNALYYQSSLIHGPTNLLTVQAFAVMAVFAQAISIPQEMQYSFSSSASRLAQSLGLHIYAPEDWQLSEDEKRERNRVFWSVYCLDKTISLRSGRPFVIQDDEISCPFPKKSFPSEKSYSITKLGRGHAVESKPDVDFFLGYTKLSRIYGKISQLLYSASSLCQQSSQLLEAANLIAVDLQSWLQSIPANLRPGHPFGRVRPTNPKCRLRLLTIHFAYNYALCAVYRRFTPMFTDHDRDQGAMNKLPLLENHNSHIEAARYMALLTKYLDIENSMPGWLLIYYPMTALTTIFVHIVCNPSDASNHNDIALMDAIVGFFGRLEFNTTGEAAFTKTSEFVRQARHIVRCSGSESRLTQSNSRQKDSANILPQSFPGNADRSTTSGICVHDPVNNQEPRIIISEVSNENRNRNGPSGLAYATLGTQGDPPVSATGLAVEDLTCTDTSWLDSWMTIHQTEEPDYGQELYSWA